MKLKYTNFIGPLHISQLFLLRHRLKYNFELENNTGKFWEKCMIEHKLVVRCLIND